MAPIPSPKRQGLEVVPGPDFSQLLHVLWRDARPAYVPFYELAVDLGVQAALLGHPVADRAATVEFYYRAGYDYVPVWPDPLRLILGDLTDPRKGYPIASRDDFNRYNWPEPSTVTFSEFDAVIPMLPAGMRIVGQVMGIFETVEYLCGYETLCYLLADDPMLVAAIFERVGALYEALYRGMARFPEVGALMISDDLGFKTQTLIAPDDLRRFVLPWHKRLARIIHDHNKPCILHSCGQLDAVMEDLIADVGIDAKHSYEDGILPVTAAHQRFGGRIAILGGYDVDRLCRHTPAEVEDYTRRLLRELGADGAYALGTGNTVTKYVPLDNYRAMLNTGWRYRNLV